MRTVLVGFDSAWTQRKRGALAAVALEDSGSRTLLQEPVAAGFDDAADRIECWLERDDRLVVMLDQPTIVPNATGCRDVERLVSSVVARARGGVQPANTGRADMFGPGAPVWRFIKRLEASLDPTASAQRSIIETYPVLALLGMGWVCEGSAVLKYNPERRKTYRPEDWATLCERLAAEFRNRSFGGLAGWCRRVCLAAARPTKGQQDQVDAMLCLLVGLIWQEGGATVQVGSMAGGLMVVPDLCGLTDQFRARLETLGWAPDAWGIRLDRPYADQLQEASVDR